jgi:hypothetical protein
MSAAETISIEGFFEKFNLIVENYRAIMKNITNVSDDIKKLENVHGMYINSGKLDMLNNSIYVDDIKYQIDIIKIEYDYLSKIYQSNINKFYRDLFKLYNKVIKYLLTVYKENKDIIIRIWNNNEKIEGETNDFKKLKKVIKVIADSTRTSGSYASDSKIFEEIKKKHYSKIKLYDELDTIHNYHLDDVVIIYQELELRLTDLKLSKELIKINLLDVKHKTDKGILGQTFVMDLNGRVDRIQIDYSIIIKLLESIVNIHLTLSNKYNKLSLTIANSVSYDEDSTETINSPKMSQTKKNPRDSSVHIVNNKNKKDINDIFVYENENDNENDNDKIDDKNDNVINKFE